MTDDADDLAWLSEIRSLCSDLDGVEEAELQGRPLFRVGRRRFAIFNGFGSPERKRWAGWGRSLHFLADPDEREALRHDGRFCPSPHHGDRGWFGVQLDDELDPVELGELLDSAYLQVASRHAQGT